MAFQISNLFSNNQAVNNQVTQGQQTVSSSDGTVRQVAQNSRAVIEQLKTMLAGDILSGTVADISEDTVQLQLGNGQMLNARLTDSALVSLGQSLTFLVESNSDQMITLKPLQQDGQQALMIQNALDAANFPLSEENIGMVKELLSQNMPIDAQSLGEMVQNMARFPEVDIQTLAQLQKLEIPVTQENITQFQAYQSYTNSISGELQNLPSDLQTTTMNLLQNGQTMESVELLQNTVNALYSDIPDDTGAQSMLHSDALSTYMDAAQQEALANQITETFGESGQQLAGAVENGTVTTQELLQQLTDLLKNQQSNGASSDNQMLSNLLQGKELSNVFQQMVAETMMLTPQSVGEEGNIQKFYKRLRGAVEQVSNQAEKASEDSPLAKNMNEVKSNIDFMNDLNRNMTYMQMPIKFSESAGNGDLYVFTNKKALQSGTDKISALLHLDMEHLGPMDIYVQLFGKNVSTNFCLESEEMLDFVYANIDKLDARLAALGYTTSFEMKLTEKQQNQKDFVEDFINHENPPAKITQFVFDAKA